MRLLLQLFKKILTLRYRVKIRGEEHLFSGKMLLLANHVALIDPQIITTFLWSYAKFRTVAQASFFSNPIIWPVLKWLKAIPIDNDISSMSRDWVLETSQKVLSALVAWDNVLLYPSGQLKTQWAERIIWKKVAYELLSALPKDVRVVLVRTTGLRWSSSSKAREWKTPSLFWFFLKWVRYWIANLFVFIPKRDVLIELEDVTKKLPKNLADAWSLDQCNQRLENFYNIRWPEPLEYTPHYFYYNDVKHKDIPLVLWSEEFMKNVKDYTSIAYDTTVFEAVLGHIHTMKPDLHKDDITLSTHVVFDLFFDSLDTAELKAHVQSLFPWSSNPPLLDLKLVWDYVMMGMGKTIWEEYLKSCDWEYDVPLWFLRDKIADFTEEKTILDLLKLSFKQDMSQSFCFDYVFGLQSRRDYMIKAYLLADIIKKYEGEYIAILLPSLSGTSLLVVATYLAWKIPVMLNRTLSQEAFEHCVKYKNIPAVLTSRSFYKKIQAPYFEKNNLVFLEDILKNITLKQKLVALYKSLRFYTPKQKEEAVILFTSWSEWLPKAVSISHQNIIQDVKWALQVVSFKTDDILLWFLPPFHSFWFTITTVCPLITGIRIVYSPDPNDAQTLAKLIEHTQATWTATTPTFFKRILSVATNKQIASLRSVVAWAEKCPLDVFALLWEKVPTAKLIEWYGITECSPVIAVNPLEKPKPGTVWLPIGWLQIVVLDLETKEKIQSPWKEWMIYVAGPSVFSGYLDKNLEDPFVQIDNQKFYKTWDLGFLDEDWYLTLTGRLKRFIKIAGEMVSLPYIENLLQEKFGSAQEVTLAIEAQELSSGKAKIVLFHTPTVSISLKEANQYLREKWVTNLISLSDSIQLEAIPVLWTWKIDYKVLKKMI